MALIRCVVAGAVVFAELVLMMLQGVGRALHGDLAQIYLRGAYLDDLLRVGWLSQLGGLAPHMDPIATRWHAVDHDRAVSRGDAIVGCAEREHHCSHLRMDV